MLYYNIEFPLDKSRWPVLISLLGGFRIFKAGEPVLLHNASKTKSLLISLVLSKNSRIQRYPFSRPHGQTQQLISQAGRLDKTMAYILLTRAALGVSRHDLCICRPSIGFEQNRRTFHLVVSASNSVCSASVKSTMYFLFGMVRGSWPDPCKFLSSVHLIKVVGVLAPLVM
jgi:hypothetical protein